MDRVSFPRPLRLLLARLPQYPPAAAAAVALNIWLGEAVSGAALPDACGKAVTIEVSDVGLRLTFSIEPDGIVACTHVPDVTIRATVSDFLALALRREDPDTLFFSRRLIIEGDTELGLFLKNSLDALPASAFQFRFPAPRRLVKSLRLQFPPRLRPRTFDQESPAWNR